MTTEVLFSWCYAFTYNGTVLQIQTRSQWWVPFPWFSPDLFTQDLRCPWTVPDKSCWVAAIPPPGPASSVLRARCAIGVMALHRICFMSTLLSLSLWLEPRVHGVGNQIFLSTYMCRLPFSKRPEASPEACMEGKHWAVLSVSPTGHLFTKPPPSPSTIAKLSYKLTPWESAHQFFKKA